MADLVTIEDLELYLLKSYDTNPSFDSQETEQAEFIISAVSTQIENYTNRTFGASSYTENLDGMGTPYLVVENYPITSLTSVSYLDQEGDVTTAIDIDYIKITYKDGILYYYAGFAHGVQNLQVVYSAGYTDIPDDLKLYALKMITRELILTDSDGTVSTEKTGDYTITYKNTVSLKKEDLSSLATYINYA